MAPSRSPSPPVVLGIVAIAAVAGAGLVAVRPAQVWPADRTVTSSAGVTAADGSVTDEPSGPVEGPVYVDPQPIAVADPDEAADLKAGILPGDVPAALSGELAVAPGSEAAPGPGPVRTVRVEAEVGLPLDIGAFADFVMETLNDPRGWGADGSVSFARTDGDADIRVLVASGGTVDTMCAPLATNGTWSCGRYGHAALNATRWFTGAEAFLDGGGDLTAYRQYLVNHEVGHLLGRRHTGCPAPGTVAPVMLQQSISLRGCLPNGWPNP